MLIVDEQTVQPWSKKIWVAHGHILEPGEAEIMTATEVNEVEHVQAGIFQ